MEASVGPSASDVIAAFSLLAFQHYAVISSSAVGVTKCEMQLVAATAGLGSACGALIFDGLA
jgi:hypothetical protein